MNGGTCRYQLYIPTVFIVRFFASDGADFYAIKRFAHKSAYRLEVQSNGAKRIQT